MKTESSRLAVRIALIVAMLTSWPQFGLASDALKTVGEPCVGQKASPALLILRGGEGKTPEMLGPLPGEGGSRLPLGEEAKGPAFLEILRGQGKPGLATEQPRLAPRPEFSGRTQRSV
jgi:hypothetical protein